MADLSDLTFPYYRTEVVSLNNSGTGFSAVTQNLAITRIGNLVTVSSDRTLTLDTETASGEYESATGLVPTWARPSAGQGADGNPRNVYGASFGGNNLQCCFVKSDGTFVVKIVQASTGDPLASGSAVVTSSTSYLIG